MSLVSRTKYYTIDLLFSRKIFLKLLKLFTSYITPKLEYITQVWSLHSKEHTDLLEKVHRWATKTVPEVRELRYRERQAAMELPMMEEKRIRLDMITMYKFLNKCDKVNIKYFFYTGNAKERT